MILQIAYIVFSFIMDGVLSLLFPASFIPYDIVFVPCLGIASLVLSNRQMNQFESLLIFTIFGLLYDFFISDMFPVYTLVFILLNVINNQWQKHIMESTIESTLLVLTSILVKEFVVYFTMTLTHQSTMVFTQWMMNRLFFTLIINGICVVVLVYLSKLVVDLMKQRELRIRKEETIPWWKMIGK